MRSGRISKRGNRRYRTARTLQPGW